MRHVTRDPASKKWPRVSGIDASSAIGSYLFHCIALYGVTSHHITLHYLTVPYITLHCIALHYVALRCVTLRYVTA